VNLSDALRNGGTTWAISSRKVNAAEMGTQGEPNNGQRVDWTLLKWMNDVVKRNGTRWVL